MERNDHYKVWKHINQDDDSGTRVYSKNCPVNVGQQVVFYGILRPSAALV